MRLILLCRLWIVIDPVRSWFRVCSTNKLRLARLHMSFLPNPIDKPYLRQILLEIHITTKAAPIRTFLETILLIAIEKLAFPRKWMNPKTKIGLTLNNNL